MYSKEEEAEAETPAAARTTEESCEVGKSSIITDRVKV